MVQALAASCTWPPLPRFASGAAPLAVLCGGWAPSKPPKHARPKPPPTRVDALPRPSKAAARAAAAHCGCNTPTPPAPPPSPPSLTPQNKTPLARGCGPMTMTLAMIGQRTAPTPAFKPGPSLRRFTSRRRPLPASMSPSHPSTTGTGVRARVRAELMLS